MTNSAKKQILLNVRKSLSVKSNDAERTHHVANYIAQHQQTYQMPKTSHKQCVELFEKHALLSGAMVFQALTLHDVAQNIKNKLNEFDIPYLRMGSEPYFENSCWHTHGVEVFHGTAAPEDLASLSLAHYGVAESGTLIVLSGEQNPVLLNFLPTFHFVVVQRKHIIACYEDAWRDLRKNGTFENPPRTIHWITGPSRSADIEQTLIMGAHGPKHLFIYLVG